MRANVLCPFRIRKALVNLVLPTFLALTMFSGGVFADDFVSELWTDIHDGGNGNDDFRGVGIDSQGSVVAAGLVKGLNSPEHHTDAYIKKYPADGSDPWTDTLDMGAVAGSKADSNDRFYDVAVDSEDNIIVVGVKSGTWTGYSMGSYHGVMLTRKYTPSGTMLWERTFQDGGGSAWNSGSGVALDGEDNIYVAGTVFTSWGSIEQQWAILKYDKDGNLQPGFPVKYDFSPSNTYPDMAFGIAVDKDGNFIAVGTRGVSTARRDWHVRKYDSNRTLVWEDTFNGPTSQLDYAQDVAVDSKGDVFVVGHTNKGSDNGANADHDWLIIKYKKDKDPGGEQRLWTRTSESADGRNEACYEVVVDPLDNALVGGYEGDADGILHWRLERRNGETGDVMAEQVWTSTQNQVIYGLTYRNRRIAACGYESNGTNNDMRTGFLVPFPPEITLLGDNPVELEVDTEYTEPGYEATDDFEGDLTPDVVVTGSVDHTTLGVYEIHYNVSASNGDPAEEKIRTVNVVDTTPPEIALEGDDPITLEVGTAYVEPGASATDNYDGDLSGDVEITGFVDDTSLGEYTLRYNVSDSSGNPAAEKTRTVNVVDTTAPEIALLGDNPMSLERGTPYEEPGFTATDNYDGGVSGSVVITGSVDENTPGSYELRYNVSDSSGNPAEEQIRTVNVVDTTPFTFTEVVEVVAGIFKLTWESRSGDTFVVWSCTDLLGEWKQELTIGSQGETTTWVDPSASGVMKFYKIERK